MTIARFQMPEARLRARKRDHAARARILSPGYRVILSGMGAAQGQGTQCGPVSPRSCSVHTAPRLSGPSPGGVGGALTGGGAPGRHPLICRFSEPVGILHLSAGSIIAFEFSDTADCWLLTVRWPHLAMGNLHLVNCGGRSARTAHALSFRSSGGWHLASAPWSAVCARQYTIVCREVK